MGGLGARVRRGRLRGTIISLLRNADRHPLSEVGVELIDDGPSLDAGSVELGRFEL